MSKSVGWGYVAIVGTAFSLAGFFLAVSGPLFPILLAGLFVLAAAIHLSPGFLMIRYGKGIPSKRENAGKRIVCAMIGVFVALLTLPSVLATAIVAAVPYEYAAQANLETLPDPDEAARMAIAERDVEPCFVYPDQFEPKAPFLFEPDKHLTNAERKACLEKYFRPTRDPEACSIAYNSSREPYLRIWCFEEAAAFKADPALCPDEGEYGGAYRYDDRTKERRDLCLAVASGDVSSCFDLENSEGEDQWVSVTCIERISLVKGDPSSCDQVPEEYAFAKSIFLDDEHMHETGYTPERCEEYVGAGEYR